MSAITCPTIRPKHPDANDVPGSVSFVGALDGDELITSASAEVIPDGLTVDDVAPSAEELQINGVAVPAGQAVQFTTSGGEDGQLYVIAISIVTDGGRNPDVRNVKLKVTSDIG